MKRALIGVSVAGIFTLLFVAFFAPVLFSGRLLAPGDGLTHSLPFYYAPFGLWTTLLQGGYPLAANIQNQAWYPLKVLLSQIPGSWNVYVVSAYVLSGCFAYGYARAITASHFAGLVGGTIYAMSGFMMAHLGHTMIIHSALWLPLTAWALEELARRITARWLVVGSLSVAGSILAGHPQISAYILGLTGVLALRLAWERRGNDARRFLIFASAMLALGLGLTAVQLVPTVELMKLGPRAELRFEEFSLYSVSPRQLATLLLPFLYGGFTSGPYHAPYIGSGPPNPAELSGYIGLLPLMLASLSLGPSRATRIAGFWLFVAGIGVLLVLGSHTPLARLVFQLPVYSQFRVPARHFLEIAFAVSVLASAGIAAIDSSRPPQRGARLKTLLATSAALLTLGVLGVLINGRTLRANALALGLDDFSLLPWTNPSVGVPLLVWLGASIAAGIYAAGRALPWKRALLFAALVADLASFAWFLEWRTNAPERTSTIAPSALTEVAASARRSHQRLLPFEGYDNPLAPLNRTLLWGVPTANAYGPLPLSRVTQLLGMATTGHVGTAALDASDRSLDLFAVRYLLTEGAEGPGSSISSHGLRWHRRDLAARIGEGCGAATGATTFWMPDSPPFQSTHVGVVSSLACSPPIAQGVEVAELVATLADGGEARIPIRAGHETAEWAADCSDVAPAMKHDRAIIFESTSVAEGTPCLAHRYVSVLPIPPGRLSKLEVRWTGPPDAALGISKLSLFDERTRRSLPIGPEMGKLGAKRWRRVASSRGAIIYENLRALPRAWTTREALPLEHTAILEAIQTSRLPDGRAFDPRTTALVEEPVSLEGGAADAVEAVGETEIVRIEPRSVQIRSASQQPAFLILSDVEYPGWVATLDGEPTRVHRVDYALRGVVVPRGEHEIRFSYRPRSLWLGVGLSTASLAGLGLLCLWAARSPAA